jgi:toxin-antitoxin system PIN domain toxin
VVLPDVSVLVYAHREDARDHVAYRRWVESTLNGDESYGMSELVLSGFLRVVTHPKVFGQPTPLGDALQFVEQLRSQANCVDVRPGPRHWDIFERLCRDCDVRGKVRVGHEVAALAIEAGCEWITTDRDYSRFGGLRWRHPLQ